MASGYDLKYIPPKKGDEWKVGILAGALEKAKTLQSLNPQSGKGLEGLVKDFLGPELANLDSQQINAVVGNYKNLVNYSIGDYVLGNIKDAVGYVGKERLMDLAANLPYAARKAQGDTPLAESDVKYNEIVGAGDKLKKMTEAMKTEEGAKKELEDEFKGVDEFAKKVWLGALGPQAFLQYRVRKAQRKFLGAIDSYGLPNYIKDAVKISDTAEKEFEEKSNEIAGKQKSELESKLALGPLSAIEQGKINDKYSTQLAELQKKYSPLGGARQFILNGSEEMPGLLPLIDSKYKAEEKKKKAEEEAATKKKADESGKK